MVKSAFELQEEEWRLISILIGTLAPKKCSKYNMLSQRLKYSSSQTNSSFILLLNKAAYCSTFISLFSTILNNISPLLNQFLNLHWIWRTGSCKSRKKDVCHDIIVVIFNLMILLWGKVIIFSLNKK